MRKRVRQERRLLKYGREATDERSRNGEALRAFDRIVALASGRPPPELALPICLDIPLGTIAVASRLVPWIGGLYRIIPENGTVKRLERMLPRHSLRDLPRIPDARISLFPDGKVKLRVGKVEITGTGKLGGHIDWLRSGETGTPLDLPCGIRTANKHVGFILLFPMSGVSWRRENAHGLKAEVREGVFGVVTPGIDLTGPWHPIPFASPDGVRASIELNQSMPLGGDYGRALQAIQEAAEFHSKGPKLSMEGEPRVGVLEQPTQEQSGGVNLPALHVTRTTDLSIETGGMASAYADAMENEEADEEMGTLTPVEIEEHTAMKSAYGQVCKSLATFPGLTTYDSLRKDESLPRPYQTLWISTLPGFDWCLNYLFVL